ncbi:MAG: sigma-54-dependent Fis family transcriptional regulator [Firmicutes bacterium]|nr:sigma-54-dependent Fis family transcriptional regulator [Bacillota bacterium]
MKNRKILLVDDEASVRRFLRDVFTSEGFTVFEAANGDEALKRLRSSPVDVTVMDLRMPGRDGMETLREVVKLDPNSKVVIMTGYATVKTAVESMKQGAFDYIVKPFENDELVDIVKTAISQGKKSHLTASGSNPQENAYPGIIGRSRQMEEIFKIIKKVALPNTTVLITGESGTGKSLIAHEIHKLSPRKQFPFITINCAVLPETLMESELFGHEKGAFTGAVSSKTGKFELANRGTVFLDEIGTLSPQTQAKLLRIIQDKKFERVGGERFLEIDVRIIAATNENLEDAVAKGKFREDLYYRLNVFSITMPPLRERAEDIPELINFFVDRFNNKLGRSIKGVSPRVMELLTSYSWPGNIRELENLIERAMILTDSSEITIDCFPAHIRSLENEKVSEVKLDNFLGKMERDIIVEALEKTDGHRAKAAALLGVSRRVLQYKLKKYGMIDGQ